MKKNKKIQKTLVLLDTHAILHRAYHALPEFSSSKGEPTGALYGLVTMLIKIIRELKPDYIIACYDLPKPTFRHEIYNKYKDGRKKTKDDLVSQIKQSRNIFNAFNIPTYAEAGFEADDLLGTIVEKIKKIEGLTTIIASGDLDTLQLVDGKKVVVYTFKKGINDTIIYDEKAVKDRFGFKPKFLVDFKGLRGDPSDNIPGIVGIGEKTATTLITNFGSIEDIYKTLASNKDKFKQIGLTPRITNLISNGEEEAHFSKTLGTIRLDAPISFNLPKKTWREDFEIEKALQVFSEFEFRSLRSRLQGLFITEKKNEKEIEENNKKEETEADINITQTKIAVWLLNSEITNPNKDDILDMAGVDKLKEAHGILIKKIEKNKLNKVYEEIEVPLTPIIKEAEKYGIGVDVDYLKKLSKKYHKKISNIKSIIWEFAGREFNINSPKQLGEILFDEMGICLKGLKKTSGGARSTRESELLKLKDSHKIVEHILEYREFQKLLSTYIDNIPAMIGEDGRLHTHLNQTGTTTGRMSSSGPNMQNIPNRDDCGVAIRNAFIAKEGYVFTAFDYSQIEIRVLAELSGDKVLIETFEKGKDIHTAVASHMFGAEEKEVTKEMRRKAKVVNFGIMYGMGINALKDAMNTNRKEAQEFYDNYFKKFPNIATYIEKVKKEAYEKGYTQTLFGRRRYFSAIKSKIPYIRASAERMAVNAPIQGTAADIIKIATIKADKALKKNGLKKHTRLMLTVHDELIYEIKKEHIDEAEGVIKTAMEKITEVKIPLVVDVVSGERWGEMKPNRLT